MPDDIELNSLPMSTLLWLDAQIKKDEAEDFKEKKGFVEYLAGFISPERLKATKMAEENTAKSSPEDMQKALDKIKRGEI